jgi:release factor glutamine methyltransferase
LIGTLLRQLRQRLSPISETAGLDAQVLLAQVLGKPRAWVLAHPEASLASEQEYVLQDYLARLEKGEPLPYVLGHWEFFGLDFDLTPATLIPRPETELIVEQALDWLRANQGRRRIVDVGTGSGCIAIAMAVNLPGLRVIASDLSPASLQVARRNAQKHGVADQIDLVVADLLPPTCEPFDLVCANLPYIPTERLRLLQVYKWEPGAALDGGLDGLEQMRRLLAMALGRVAPGGLLLLEIEATQGAAAQFLAQSSFPSAEVQVLADLAGRDRLAAVRLP